VQGALVQDLHGIRLTGNAFHRRLSDLLPFCGPDRFGVQYRSCDPNRFFGPPFPFFPGCDRNSDIVVCQYGNVCLPYPFGSSKPLSGQLMHVVWLLPTSSEKAVQDLLFRRPFQFRHFTAILEPLNPCHRPILLDMIQLFKVTPFGLLTTQANGVPNGEWGACGICESWP
jgi:hypothetical protein